MGSTAALSKTMTAVKSRAWAETGGDIQIQYATTAGNNNFRHNPPWLFLHEYSLLDKMRLMCEWELAGKTPVLLPRLVR